MTETSKCFFKKFLFKRGCEEKAAPRGQAIYGLGFIGAAVYFISTATGFWVGVLGVLKAIVWPAVLVFGLLRFLGL